jgi:uncharacterized protein YdhG (YjbR/CyaY superfamily)
MAKFNSMMRKKPTNIDQYIAEFPEETQMILDKLRATIKKAAPKAEETISYAIPCFKYHGYLIYFAGYKNHTSIYPAPRATEAFKKELAAYKGGKGTVQFPNDKPLPLGLITRIVKFRIKMNLEREKEKAKEKIKSS